MCVNSECVRCALTQYRCVCKNIEYSTENEGNTHLNSVEDNKFRAYILLHCVNEKGKLVISKI